MDLKNPSDNDFNKRRASLLRIHEGFSDRCQNAKMVFEDREAYGIPYSIN